MAFKMNYKSSSLCKNLEGMDEKLRVVLLMYLSTKALGLESYMKLNRPWTDRTGMAKSYYGRIERGDINASLDKYIKILKVLNLKFEDILKL